MLCLIFATTYSMTTMLSLLFHLPTTGDFQKKAGELAAIHSVSRLTGGLFDLDRLFDTITASPVEAGTGHSAWLALVDARSGSLRPQLVSANKITHERVGSLIDTEAFVGEVSQLKGPVLLNQATADIRIRSRPGDGIGSLLVMPLVARREILGALFVAKEVANGFEKDDIDTTQTFADQAALALDNARLFEERIEKERMAKELEIAERVQKRLLPQSIPEIDGAGIAASSVSATEVGGDYFDILEIDNDRYGIIVGDVSGKGTSAAFYMAELKGIFQSLGRLSPSPSEFLTNANKALARSMERSFFISAVYAILDTKKEELILARAGHPPVVVTHADGKTDLLRTTGMGLGLDRGAVFCDTISEQRISLRRGDAFVFYTDGIVESRGSAGQEFGYDRLCDSVGKHRDLGPDGLHDAILKDLHAFIGQETYDDDMTLLVLKWQGIPRIGAVSLASEAAQSAEEAVDGNESGQKTNMSPIDQGEESYHT
jgi:serine phosphatase RsbU (regulator of sigma subunit)